MSGAVRMYRALLLMLPADLRREFGDDMVLLLRDRLRGSRGAGRRFRTWIRACLDVFRQARNARREPPFPGRRTSIGSVLGDLIRDARHAVRSLGRSPVLTTVALVSLALGIGVNAAVFSLVNAVFLRPLPYERSDDLLDMKLEIETLDGERSVVNVWSYPYYDAFRRAAEGSVVELTALYVSAAMSLEGPEAAERIHVEYASRDYLTILGARAARGRLFTPEETAPGAALPVVVLSDGGWRRLLAADPSAVGGTVRIDGRDMTVVGVAEPGFDGLSSSVDFWVPLGMAGTLMYPEVLEEPRSYWMNVIARKRHEVDLAATTTALRPFGGPMLEAVPAERYRTLAPLPTRLRDSIVDPALRQPFALALGAVAFVLLIACANVANLLLSRAVERRREIATRVAIGAVRGRVLRQLVTEGLVLGLAGAVAGIGLAAAALRLLRPLMPRGGAWSAYVQVADQAAIDLPVLAFTLVLGAGSALLFSLLPARQVLRFDLTASLENRGASSRHRGRAVIVVAQLGLAVVLLVGAGLMVRTLRNMSLVDTRASAENVLLARFQLPAGKYRPPTGFYLPLLERVEAMPEVRAAAYATAVPLSGLAAFTMSGLEGEAADPEDFGESSRPIGLHVVSDDYLDVIGAPLLSGRNFAAEDDEGAPRVALVNAAAARTFWPDGSALGRRLSVGMWAGGAGWIEVVGVVDDVRYEGVTGEVEPQVYLSFRQVPRSSVYLAIRTDGAPQAVLPRLREAATAVDPQAPVFGVRTLADVERDATAHSRFLTVLLVALAAIAALLAGAGVQGVMLMAVAARRRELGIRMALGADRKRIVRDVVVHGLGLAAAGGALGVGAALALRGVLRGQLFGVAAGDPLAIGATAGVLVALAGLASLIPALRAAATDPIRTLRED